MITVMFQNINGLPVKLHHPKNKNIKDLMITHKIVLLGLMEVNI